MAEQTRDFAVLVCDFPDCKEVFNDGEYSAWIDISDAISAAQDEESWLVNRETYEAYCPDHVVEKPEAEDDEIDYDDPWGSVGRYYAPMEDTFENRLKVGMKRVLQRIEWRFRQAQNDLERGGYRDRWVRS